MAKVAGCLMYAGGELVPGKHLIMYMEHQSITRYYGNPAADPVPTLTPGVWSGYRYSEYKQNIFPIPSAEMATNTLLFSGHNYPYSHIK